MRASTILHIVLAVTLLPILGYCLLLEVVAGTSMVWTDVQPGQTSRIGATLWALYAGAGPAAVLVTTLRSRSRIPSMMARALRIEKVSLAFAIPLGLVGGFVIAAQSII